LAIVLFGTLMNALLYILLAIQPHCAAYPDPEEAVPVRSVCAGAEIQDFVETRFGYRRPNQPAERLTVSPVSDLRDAATNTPPPQRRGLTATTTTQHEAAEQILLNQLNAPHFSQDRYAFGDHGPKYNLSEMDYKVRKVQASGPLALPVPAPGTEQSLSRAPEFVVIAVRAAGTTMAKTVEAASAASGFRPFRMDIDGASGADTASVRGWIEPDRLDALRAAPGVISIKKGLDAAAYETGIIAPETDTLLSIRVPASGEPKDFMKLALTRLGEGAGFVWEKTISVRAVPLADGTRRSRPEYIITVAGRMPVNTAAKASAYPFVLRVDTSPKS